MLAISAAAWQFCGATVGTVGVIFTGWFAYKANTQAKTAAKQSEQLLPNGGSSIADSVRRIEAKLDHVSENHGAALFDLVQRVAHIEGRNETTKEQTP